MCILIGIDKNWERPHLYKGHGLRICFGFISITILPLTENALFLKAHAYIETLED